MARKCSECSLDYFTLKTCLKCHNSMCYLCVDRHKENNSNHIFGLDTVNDSRYDKRCERHHYSKFEAFCNTCSELACISCLHETHVNHDIWSIEDAAKVKRSQVAKEISAIEQTLEQIKIQREIRERNHKGITVEVESIENKLVQNARKINDLICEKRKELKSLLDPQLNETFYAYLQEWNQIHLSEFVHKELEKSLRGLVYLSGHQLVNFLCGYEKFRKSVEDGVTLPRHPSDQYIPMCIVYQEAEEDEIKNVLPNIGLTRGMQIDEQSKPTNSTARSTERRKENYKQANIIANLKKELESKVSDMREEIQRLEAKLQKSQNRVAVLEDRFKSNKAKKDYVHLIYCSELRNKEPKDALLLLERSSSNQQRVENTQSKKDVQRLEAELKTLQTIATQLDERKKASSNLEREESTRRKEIQRLEAELQKWQNCAEQLEDRWEATCKEKESLNRQVKRIENEKEDLKTRLSQVAGAKLTAGNSGITDLGDKYRPTRIAEMYSELYDTEWTEAMDDILQLNKWSEESIVQHMFIVLQECFNACKKIACHQMTELCKHLFPDVETRDMEKYMDIHVTEVKQLKDARKGTASVVGKMLSKSLIDRQGIRNECMEYNDVNSLIIDEIMKTSYGTTCITVCWFMVVQDPEMCLDEHLKQGDKFNKDVYKEYTRSGKKVEYSVWPALYLHKDGPLLTKGVAQAFN